MIKIGFVDFGYPKRYEILLSDVVVEETPAGSRLKVQDQVYPRIDLFEVTREDPFYGLDGWLTLKNKATTLVFYFKESQKAEVDSLFKELSFVTTIL